MKQTITPEQLNELSDKGKEKLRILWTFNNSDLAYVPSTRQETFYFRLQQNENFEEVSNEILPLLSIGQMIEFLGKGWIYDWSDKKWHICKEPDLSKSSECHFMQDSKELADALWEACKEVLETN